MSCPRWAEGLSVAGLYYDGVIDGCKLQTTLELHKRDTTSTFGTHSSRRVSRDVKKGYQIVNNESDMHEADQASTVAQKENVNPHCTIGADASTREKVQVKG